MYIFGRCAKLLTLFFKEKEKNNSKIFHIIKISISFLRMFAITILYKVYNYYYTHLLAIYCFQLANMI